MMKEFKGTKGEWSVCKSTNSIHTDNGLWYDWFHVRKVKEVELLSNAKLIAAAPDLLEALQDIIEGVDDGIYDILKVDYENARKAIEKALK